jgi:hypothetical protein
MKFINLKRESQQLIVVVLIAGTIMACNNNKTAAIESTDKENIPMDSSSSETISAPPVAPPSALNTFTRPNADKEAEKQKMIAMQIDSTYAAITLLDEVKEELNEESNAELSLAERNKKSKAIFNINMIQNELTRALDASILENLRTKTDELEGISKQLGKNIAHLQHVTENLNKAAKCVTKVTNFLAYCLSQGWIKPVTPKKTVGPNQ